MDREIDDNLREYYRRFLQDVRGLKQSTVKHYDEALKKISQILIAKEKIKNSIYEIRTLDRLLEIMEELKRDEGFLALDKRGHSMYSAGMNNYLKFANGEMFKQINRNLTVLDVPMPAKEKIKRTVLEYPRTAIITRQVVQYADYRCEMDSEHQSFIDGRNNKPYMEGHHAIPLHYQGKFEHSLDIYANVVCLCPICHRKIHYGISEDRRLMMDEIWEKRIGRLNNCGISMSKTEFENLILDDR